MVQSTNALMEIPVTTSFDDMLGTDDGYPKPKRQKAPRTEFLSELHKTLTRGLPDFVDEFGVLDTRKLAKKIGISFQAIYGWLNHNRISRKRVETVIYLSESTVKVPADWKPLTKEDLWDFLSK